MEKSLTELMNKVVKNDYCIGCGICAAIKDSPLVMRLDENGKYRPFMEKQKIDSYNNFDYMLVCPFSNRANNETEIANELFKEDSDQFNEYTGYFLKNYAGYVLEGEYRKKGSSGGMGSWIAAQLLEDKYVDAIIHVKATQDNTNPLFKYDISNNVEELLKGSKSKYYPVEMSEVLKFVRNNNKRFAIIGVPCFIKGIRLLAKQDPIIKDRIKYCIGLVCGHLKSDMFAKSIGWQLGIEPDKLTDIDFRVKLEGRPASKYGVKVTGMKNGQRHEVTAPTKELYTTNWGYGFFKYNACEFCDDVLAETADVTVGDAWLPEYINDSLGTNVIIVRNPIIQKILEENRNKVFIEELSVEKIYESQAGGFRHRREGLSYRLYQKEKRNEWYPKKRVEPNNKLSRRRKKIYEKRTILSQKSFESFKLALEKKDFQHFINDINPLVMSYNKFIQGSYFFKMAITVKRQIKNILKSNQKLL